ncbi:unnamed protein product [Gongylonema pulchrum]|uniref:TOG domain-containing protein n=1 Tax=Gongylonema pulchrum TaxID=637853 RepID=A0A183D676_9BILA|nr:unnamed protein product [Gongylonema pulchrum]
MGLGAVMRVLGEKQATAAIGEVLSDKGKSTKITEYCKKAEQEYQRYQKTRIERGPAEADEPSGSGENEVSQKVTDSSEFQDKSTVDAWNSLEETKISEVLPKNMEEMLTSESWKKRVEVLEALLDVLRSNPRLDRTENHTVLINVLCNALEKDANVSVAALAAKCITAFAQGLRYAFSRHIPNIYVVAFEKFKEKKELLRKPLIELCDTLALFVSEIAWSIKCLEKRERFSEDRITVIVFF